jgi:hypothetical protein
MIKISISNFSYLSSAEKLDKSEKEKRLLLYTSGNMTSVNIIRTNNQFEIEIIQRENSLSDRKIL